jgi:hypothetical protein
MERADPPSEATIDWAGVRGFLRTALRAHLPEACAADLQDLIQEASVRVLRTLRREEVRNLEALMNDIARKTAIDFMRSRSRWSAMVLKVQHRQRDLAHGSNDDPEFLGDPLERTRFVVLAWFRQNSAGCHELAARYFTGTCGWPVLAEELGLTPQALRRRWSRCVERLRQAVQGDREFLWKWAQPTEGTSDDAI